MEILFSVMVFALVSTATPGPNNIMIMASGLNYGVVRSLPHWLGICLGFPLMVIAVGMGLNSVFAHLPMLQSWVKVVGIGYLLYLAYRIAVTPATPESETGTQSRPMRFYEAVAFQWVNPKAWVMSVGALAVFSSAQSSVMSQSLWIALAFMLVGFPCVGAWLLGGAMLRRWLSQPFQRRLFNGVMAALLVLSVVPMLEVPTGAVSRQW